MITDAIIDFFLLPLKYLLSNCNLPDINIAFSDSAFDTLYQICYSASYLLPTETILICFFLSVAIDNFDIILSLLLRFRSFLTINK